VVKGQAFGLIIVFCGLIILLSDSGKLIKDFMLAPDELQPSVQYEVASTRCSQGCTIILRHVSSGKRLSFHYALILFGLERSDVIPLQSESCTPDGSRGYTETTSLLGCTITTNIGYENRTRRALTQFFMVGFCFSLGFWMMRGDKRMNKVEA